jgi:hypothetical protein
LTPLQIATSAVVTKSFSSMMSSCYTRDRASTHVCMIQMQEPPYSTDNKADRSGIRFLQEQSPQEPDRLPGPERAGV